jgi:hypothetical protein
VIRKKFVTCLRSQADIRDAARPAPILRAAEVLADLIRDS